MRQDEFLNILQDTLAGRVSDRVIQENLNYYRNYISEEIRKGEPEDEILQSLGDPRLLAKTIEESNKYANGDESYSSAYEKRSYHGNKTVQDQDYQVRNRTIQIKGWLTALMVILVLFAIFRFVFSVLSFFAPIILVGGVGYFIYKMITGNGD